MNRKGFTALELVIFLACMLIFAAIFAPSFVKGMEMQKLMPADTENISTVSQAMRHDTSAVVTVLVYQAEWTHDNTSDAVDFGKEAVKQLQKRGVPVSRINVLYANRSGLIEDPVPTPDKDGIYLYLE